MHFLLKSTLFFFLSILPMASKYTEITEMVCKPTIFCQHLFKNNNCKISKSYGPCATYTVICQIIKHDCLYQLSSGPKACLNRGLSNTIKKLHVYGICAMLLINI